MTRQELLKNVREYFSLKELVCPHILSKFGQTAWHFLSTPLLETLLVLRKDIFKTAINVNYGSFTQRGVRCNLCQLVKDKTLKNQIYMSAHNLGEALDFDVKGLTASEARAKIIKNKDMLPYNIRMENGVNWVHIDLYDTDTKLYTFNA